MVVAGQVISLEIYSEPLPEEVLAGMRAKTPLGRLGEPEDIANTYLWLASDEAAYLHGTTISVDGGIVLGT